MLFAETQGFAKSGPCSELWDQVVFSPLSSHLLILGTAFWEHRARLTYWSPPPLPPLPDELGSASADIAFCMCVRLVKNGVSIGHGSQIQAFGVLFWCFFCTFLLQSAIIEKVCFAHIKHTILLNLRAWVQTFFRSFFEPATLLAIFSSRLTFGMIFDHFDSPMAPFWPPVARQIFTYCRLQALVNVSVNTRRAQGVPNGLQEPQLPPNVNPRR